MILFLYQLIFISKFVTVKDVSDFIFVIYMWFYKKIFNDSIYRYLKKV